MEIFISTRTIALANRKYMPAFAIIAIEGNQVSITNYDIDSEIENPEEAERISIQQAILAIKEKHGADMKYAFAETQGDVRLTLE